MCVRLLRSKVKSRKKKIERKSIFSNFVPNSGDDKRSSRGSNTRIRIEKSRVFRLFLSVVAMLLLITPIQVYIYVDGSKGITTCLWRERERERERERLVHMYTYIDRMCM